jgi:hypothetical protein
MEQDILALKVISTCIVIMLCIHLYKDWKANRPH